MKEYSRNLSSALKYIHVSTFFHFTTVVLYQSYKHLSKIYGNIWKCVDIHVLLEIRGHTEVVFCLINQCI